MCKIRWQQAYSGMLSAILTQALKSADLSDCNLSAIAEYQLQSHKTVSIWLHATLQLDFCPPDYSLLTNLTSPLLPAGWAAANSGDRCIHVLQHCKQSDKRTLAARVSMLTIEICICIRIKGSSCSLLVGCLCRQVVVKHLSCCRVPGILTQCDENAVHVCNGCQQSSLDVLHHLG